MSRRRKRLRLAAALLCVCAGWVFVSAAPAGGPLAVGGPSLGTAGLPLVWSTAAPIRYWTDGGGLGILTNAQANDMVQRMFRVWDEVPTAAVSLQRAGQVTISDGDISSLSEFELSEVACESGTQSPIIYDQTGVLFDLLIGDALVIGFAGPCGFNSAGLITGGLAAMNDRMRDGVNTPTNPELTADEFETAMIHEFGHFLGLDHSLVPCFAGCLLEDLFALPTMFPVLVTLEMKTLAPDDIAWLSQLYPAPSFSASYGTVSGRVLFSDGIRGVQGVIVTLRQVDNPDTPEDESRRMAFSAFSGYRFTGNPGQSFTADYLPCRNDSFCQGGFLGDNRGGSNFGSRDPALRGVWEISVPAGTYTIRVDSANTGFNVPVGPLEPVFPLPGVPEFWNVGESATDDEGLRDTIVVTAGGTIGGIDVILNGTPSLFDQFEQSDAPPSASRRTTGAPML